MTGITKLSRSIEGKVALITGAASGMGRATAALFTDERARVAVTGLNAARVAEAVAEIGAAGGVIYYRRRAPRGWRADGEKRMTSQCPVRQTGQQSRRPLSARDRKHSDNIVILFTRQDTSHGLRI